MISMMAKTLMAIAVMVHVISVIIRMIGTFWLAIVRVAVCSRVAIGAIAWHSAAVWSSWLLVVRRH